MSRGMSYPCSTSVKRLSSLGKRLSNVENYNDQDH